MNPYTVDTAMSSFSGSGLFVVHPTAFAKAAVATIGIQHNTFGCFTHAIQVNIQVPRETV